MTKHYVICSVYQNLVTYAIQNVSRLIIVHPTPCVILQECHKSEIETLKHLARHNTVATTKYQQVWIALLPSKSWLVLFEKNESCREGEVRERGWVDRDKA